jgi:hypothetical protein
MPPLDWGQPAAGTPNQRPLVALSPPNWTRQAPPPALQPLPLSPGNDASQSTTADGSSTIAL